MDERTLEALKSAVKGAVLENEPMARHTTFRIGGPAAAFVEPKNCEELADAVSVLEGAGAPYVVLGGGSNILFPDAGYPGAVLSTRGVSGVTLTGETLVAGCGVTLAHLAKKAVQDGLTGLEALSGIPGTVGGAVRMNAGCYGTEVKDVLYEAELLREGRRLIVSAKALEFGYRRAGFLRPRDVVLSAKFTLRYGRVQEIRAAMRAYAVKRAEKQPLAYPSAGSTFKRPAGGYAAELIERAGLKGFRVGGAAVSEKHAGFVVNLGGANSGDVRKLIDYIQKTVYNRFNVKLEPEMVIIE